MLDEWTEWAKRTARIDRRNALYAVASAALAPTVTTN